jgi:cysteine desulfurase
MPAPAAVYLDHAASTPMRPEAVSAMLEVMADPALCANPASNHLPGRAAKQRLEEMRENVAAYFAVDPQAVVFNSGGSEGDTHALMGAARLLGASAAIAISAVEHEAVLGAAQLLRQMGHALVILPVDTQGVVDLDAVESLLSRGGCCLGHGCEQRDRRGQPVAEVAACRRHNAVYHCDAVRGGAWLAALQRNPDIHLLNFTGHKFGGPRGVVR